MDSVNRETLDNFFKEQLEQEFAGKENIPNVLLKNKSKQSKKVGKKQAETELLHKMWETKLLAAFNQLKSTERDKFNKYAQRRSSGVFPFLCALPDDVFVDIIMTSMKSLPSSGNIAFVLCCQLGQEVYSRYVISQRHERGYYSELSNIYSK
uniref:DNA-directed RNA polymerase N-terminal domain-containing protein n=1 Tax=Ciona savignyi TaxID=51511 RepID=H2Y633_CIOSA